MVRAAARTGRPLLISTGMAEPSEIDAAMQAATDAGARGSVYSSAPRFIRHRTML